MCDYSLCGLPNRLAIEGEELITHRFKTGTMGMASPAELEAIVARSRSRSSRGFWARLRAVFVKETYTPLVVCLPPGATLRVCNCELSVTDDMGNPFASGGSRFVRFIQRGGLTGEHRDAIEFDNGDGLRVSTLVAQMPAGVRMKVLSLIAEPIPERSINAATIPDRSVRHFYEEEDVLS